MVDSVLKIWQINFYFEGKIKVASQVLTVYNNQADSLFLSTFCSESKTGCVPLTFYLALRKNEWINILDF